MSAQVSSRSFQMMVFAVMMLAMVVVSFGAPGEADARSSSKVDIRFERLDVVQEGSRMTVDYTINRNDWGRLQGAKIEPRMDLYLPGQRSTRFEHHAGYTLTRASGKVVFQRVPTNSRSREVGIRVVDAKGGKQVGAVSMGRQKGDEIRVTVRVSQPAQPARPVAQPADRPSSRPVAQPAPRPSSRPSSRPAGQPAPRPSSRPVDRPSQRPSGDSQVEIINACKRNTTFSSDMDKCLSSAKSLRGHQTVAVIDACGKHRHGLSACMERAVRLPERQQVSVINACGQESTFASDMNKCMDTASTFRLEAAPVIHACGEATSFGSDMDKCMSAAAGYRKPAAPIVRACASASTFSSDLVKCLNQSR